MKNDEVCRKCKSTDLDFTKWIHEGKKQGKSFHYKAHCRNCGYSYNVSRSKKVFDKVKDKPWFRKGNHYRRVAKR